MPGTIKDRGGRLRILVLLILAFGVFVNTFGNEFTYDDFPTILEDRAVTGGDIAEVFKGSRAIRQLSFMLDYRLFGRSPFGYHVENAIFHAVDTVLLYEFLTLLSLTPTASFYSGLLFAVHPIHVEAVAGIANRKELLSLLFSLLSFICYIRAVRSHGKRAGLLTTAFLLWIAAALSKQTAALLPFATIIYDHCFLKKEERLIGRVALPLTFLILPYLAYRFMYPSFALFYSRPENLDIKYRYILFTAATAFFYDLRYLILPFQLSADHTISYVYTMADPFFAASAVLITCYLAAMSVCWKFDRFLFFMLAWVVIFILPTANLVPGTSYFFAERYLYIPSVGYAALVGRLFDLLGKRSGRFVMVLFTAVMVLFSYNTVSRNRVWLDERTLWQDATRKSPRSVFAHNNLGNVYYLKGDYKMAVHHYEKALEINPRHPESLYNLANIYYETGDRGRALTNYRSFLEVWDGDKGTRREALSKVRSLQAGVSLDIP